MPRIYRFLLHRRGGFTLAELLIAVALILILIGVVLVNWKSQVNKGFDVKRKSNLHDIQKAFEEYHTDKGCYPPDTILNNCGSSDLLPYLQSVPCDPQFRTPYLYIPNPSPNNCSGYRILARLSNINDPDILTIGCQPTGCGFENGYNWGLSMGVPVYNDGFFAYATWTPVPTALPTIVDEENWACTPEGIDGLSYCNKYEDPVGAGCHAVYPNDPSCQNRCNDPEYITLRCAF